MRIVVHRESSARLKPARQERVRVDAAQSIEVHAAAFEQLPAARPPRQASSVSVQPPMNSPPMKICGIVVDAGALGERGADPPAPIVALELDRVEVDRAVADAAAGRTAGAPTSRTRTTPARTSRPAARDRRSPRSTKARASAVIGGARQSAGAADRARPADASKRTARRRARQLDFLLRHLRGTSVEQRRAAGSARRCRAACTARSRRPAAPRADLQRAGQRGAARDAREDALLGRESRARARSASAPLTGTTRRRAPARRASSASLGMKSGAQPCTACGRNTGWLAAGEPSAARAWAMPLPSTCELSGSQTTIRVSGRSRAQHARRRP